MTPEQLEAVRAKHRAYSNKWYALNKDQAKVASSRWEKKNRVKRTAAQAVRRATGTQFESDLRKRYKLTPAQYYALIDDQGGGCAICGATRCADGRRLVVDHCHTTGTVRGVLCSRCNAGIGMLGDDLKGVLRAIRYLTTDSRFL